MKANTKKKLKYGFYFLLGMIMVLVVATVIYFMWILPVIAGKWKAIAVIPWYYCWCYLYYAFTKRYTRWWKTLEE